MPDSLHLTLTCRATSGEEFLIVNSIFSDADFVVKLMHVP